MSRHLHSQGDIYSSSRDPSYVIDNMERCKLIVVKPISRETVKEAFGKEIDSDRRSEKLIGRSPINVSHSTK